MHETEQPPIEKPLASPCPECDPEFTDHNGDEDD